ncbi:MAG: sugar ABC transporter substrate-binding protein, partial [Pedobacter sp.]|nr:sugar ABC transporter substrate-binding protein [Pedobacter sp.]
SGSQYKDIAYQFLQFVTTAINDKLLTLEGGIGCRLSTWKDREINQLIPFYHKLEMLHQVAKMLPQRKNWASIVAIIDEMMQKVMHMQHNLNDILTNAQEKINSIRL